MTSILSYVEVIMAPPTELVLTSSTETVVPEVREGAEPNIVAPPVGDVL